jgi:hypothetical protein
MRKISLRREPTRANLQLAVIGPLEYPLQRPYTVRCLLDSQHPSRRVQVVLKLNKALQQMTEAALTHW